MLSILFCLLPLCVNSPCSHFSAVNTRVISPQRTRGNGVYAEGFKVYLPVLSGDKWCKWVVYVPQYGGDSQKQYPYRH